MLNASKLRFLIGENHFTFPVKDIIENLNGTETVKYTELSADQIIDSDKKTGSVMIIKSFDPMSDKKHPLQIAIERYQNKGLSKQQMYDVVTHTPSIKKGQMVAKYGILNELLSDDLIKNIEEELRLQKLLIENRSEDMKKFFNPVV